MRGKTIISILTLALILAEIIPKIQINAATCPDLRVVFARGSGGVRNVDPNYLNYKTTIENKLKTTNLKYEFIDLDYPAVGVGIDKLGTTIGAYVGAGESYEFGDSVNAGVKNLAKLVNDGACANTKYVIGGYSQGAMVISKALKKLNPNKLIYAATFGDPKIYLPEGKGLLPAACRNKNLSSYRAYVPDCRAYKGLLGSYVPYQPANLEGKVGTWCNRRDVFCSSYFNITDHLRYIDDELYEDAARVIHNKVTKHFGIKNTLTSPHDTVILIDSTASMGSLYSKYKNEALRLTKKTLDSGGRIALFDYRDLDDPYTPVEHCNFETCTLEKVTESLNNLPLDGGGDERESLLSSSLHVMKALKWKKGATKSLVVLTDDGFLSPDRDGVTLSDVVKLSKIIDPVNFYIVTNEEFVGEYEDLAAQTDGRAVVIGDDIGLLTDEIMERFDSLPAIEELAFNSTMPELNITGKQVSGTEIRVDFNNTGERVIVALDDTLIGVTNGSSFTVRDLVPGRKYILTLTPLAGDIKGESVSVELLAKSSSGIFIPKAPNTGSR